MSLASVEFEALSFRRVVGLCGATRRFQSLSFAISELQFPCVDFIICDSTFQNWNSELSEFKNWKQPVVKTQEEYIKQTHARTNHQDKNATCTTNMHFQHSIFETDKHHTLERRAHGVEASNVHNCTRYLSAGAGCGAWLALLGLLGLLGFVSLCLALLALLALLSYFLVLLALLLASCLRS